MTTDTIDATLAMPRFELQTPNLRERLDHAIAKARSSCSPIERREWLDEAQSLCERLADASAICACGVAYNAMTGRCEACDERHEQLLEDRRRFGAMADQRDAGVPF